MAGTDTTPDVAVAHRFAKKGMVPARANPDAPGAARLALRTATHVVHQRMHRHPGFARLAAGVIGRGEYCRLLARSFGFLAVAESLAGLSDSRSECLARDLADLGLTADDISALPRCKPMQIGGQRADLIGAQYVLIGASLGGKVMAKAIGGRHGKDALPMRFLTGLGENDWKVFASDLEASLPDTDSRKQAAAAATATFAAYEDWMTWDE